MKDHQSARINMVDSQIHPMGVVNEDILDVFRSVRREDFVPSDFANVAYGDEDLSLGQGRFLMEPITHARLVQALDPKKSDKVLDVGCATGYSTAIFASLCSHVVGVEPHANLLAAAESNWARMGYGNIMPHNGPFLGDQSQKDTYDIILVNGAVSEIPQILKDKLTVNGRMVVVVRGRLDRIGRAVLVTKNAQSIVGERVLFDSSVPYLPGFEPKNEFVF